MIHVYPCIAMVVVVVEYFISTHDDDDKWFDGIGTKAISLKRGTSPHCSRKKNIEKQYLMTY